MADYLNRRDNLNSSGTTVDTSSLNQEATQQLVLAELEEIKTNTANSADTSNLNLEATQQLLLNAIQDLNANLSNIYGTEQSLDAFLTTTAPSPRLQLDGIKAKAVTVQVIVYAINPGVNHELVFRVEGSHDGVNWGNIDINDKDTIFTESGVYLLTYKQIKIKFLRMLIVGQNNSSSASVDCKLRVGSA